MTDTLAARAPLRARRLGTWSATALVVSEVVGVGIFLAPATMMRTMGSVTAALAVWLVMAALTVAGALCYAELATRFPKAGGSYVFLREAFGARAAFLFGWMALLVMDPGLTAALGIGMAKYLLVVIQGSPTLVKPVALTIIVVFGLLTLLGLEISAGLMRWTMIAKLAIVGVLVCFGVAYAFRVSEPIASQPESIGPDAIAGSIIAAFFAFGGWWELGRMSEEVESPRRTMPRALIGGVVLVAVIYIFVTIAFALTRPANAGSDEALVSLVGSALFGSSAGRLLAAMVVVAVAGSLAAVLLSSPRVYVAMARDGLFPSRFARIDERRGTAPAATVIQIVLACVLVILGTFEEILGYFIPEAVFFLGLSAAGLLVLPRPRSDETVFRAPMHPGPIAVFLLLIVALLALFLMGQPKQTLLGAAVVLIGVPVSLLIIPRRGR